MRHRRKDWISVLKKNRNLETNSFELKDAQSKHILLEGPHISIEDLVPLIPANAYRAVTVGEQTYWTFTLAVHIPGLGKVHLVISFQNAELSGTYAVLVSNRADWSAFRIISTYLQRWPIETFYQDGKEHLGFDEYRMRNAKAIQKHWCLVFVAYSFLHLDCLPASLKRSSSTHSDNLNKVSPHRNCFRIYSPNNRLLPWLNLLALFFKIQLSSKLLRLEYPPIYLMWKIEIS